MENCREPHGNRADALARKDSFYHLVIQFTQEEEIKTKMQEDERHDCGESLMFPRWTKPVSWEDCLVCALSCCLSLCVRCPPDSSYTHPDTSLSSAPHFQTMSEFGSSMLHMSERLQALWRLLLSPPVTFCLRSGLSQLSPSVPLMATML